MLPALTPFNVTTARVMSVELLLGSLENVHRSQTHSVAVPRLLKYHSEVWKLKANYARGVKVSQVHQKVETRQSIWRTGQITLSLNRFPH